MHSSEIFGDVHHVQKLWTSRYKNSPLNSPDNLENYLIIQIAIFFCVSTIQNATLQPALQSVNTVASIIF